MKRHVTVWALVTMLVFSCLPLPGAAQPQEAPDAAGGPAAPGAAPATQSRYTITDLGTPGEAFAVNNVGQVVGRFATGTGSTYGAFIWDDGVLQSLGTLGGDSSEAYDINDDGQVAGISKISTGYTRAFRWQNGSMQNLGTLGGNSSGGLGINNAGQVVGWAITGAGRMRAFLWSGGMADLGALNGMDSYGYGVNDAGQAVGWAYVGSQWPYDQHAFRYSGGMQDLGTLGWRHSIARAINANGDAVGYLVNSNQNAWSAFLSQGGGMQNLGGSQSIAYDINNAGLIVGESGGAAVLWDGGQMQSLSSLIPPNSGWSLRTARGINNRGQIVGSGTHNGQPRAFLISPRAYRWTNPSGGSWHVATNWDPQGDPGNGDTVIFGLNGQYTVDASALAAAAGPAVNFPVGRAVISGTNTVEFVNLALNLLDDSVSEPALTVTDGGTVKITSGTGNMIHAAVGGAPPANPTNPPIARLQVFNSGTSLNGTGRLSIGDEGVGDLFVANGGHLTSAESRLGGVLPTGFGSAAVGGNGSLWETGNIAVGYGVSGTLAIENGGRVTSDDAYVSYGVLSEHSQVTVEGAGASQSSLWALQGGLFIGQTDFGFVEVLNGGDLYVSQDVQIKNGELRVDGRRPNGDPSDVDVLGSVFVGGPGSANLLALWNAARGGIDGDLIVGKDGEGAVILWGNANLAHPTQLDVVDVQAGLCAIGQAYDGGVSLDGGGLLRCRNIQLGKVGTSGAGSLTVDGGMVRALDVLTVGQVGGGTGLVEMKNNALVATNGTYITPNGVVTGTGTLAVGFLGLQNDGTLAPSIQVNTPLAAPGASQAQDTATLAVDGNLNVGPNGRVRIPLIGSGAGQYGSLAITGSAHLDGVLALDFSSGYAPRQGDTFTFLAAGGGLSGTFDRVDIRGLRPGFEYDLDIVNGQVVLEALNDGVSSTIVFLPRVMG